MPPKLGTRPAAGQGDRPGLVGWRDGTPVRHEAFPAPMSRAVRYGDGLFSTLRVQGGRLLDGPRHAARLLSGAGTLDLDPPDGFASVERVVQRLLEAGRILGPGDGDPDGILRCQWSAAGGRGYGRDRRSIAFAEWFPAPPPRELRVEVLEDGAVPVPSLPALKSCSAVAHVLAGRAAARRGVPEIVRQHRGWITEGVAANLFWIRDGVVRTPSPDLPLYPGVVRERTIEVARSLGLAIEEGRWRPEELAAADGLAFTGSVRGVEPVVALDGRPLSTPPVLRELAAAVAAARAADALLVSAPRDGRSDGEA